VKPKQDRLILYSSAFLRSLATGAVGVLLGIHLSRLGLEPALIGSVIAAGLFGAACATLVVTLAGHRLARRKLLACLSLMAGGGCLVVAQASSPALLALFAFLGMVNGMGRDRGASLVLEQAMLPATVRETDRTRAFAWYNLLQDAGHALGGLLATVPGFLERVGGLEEIPSHRITLALCALLMLVPVLFYLRLSAASEPPPSARRPPLSPDSRRILWKISSLFALDSLAGGFLTTALLSFFFFQRFGVGEMSLGLLFFFARVANAFSHLGAAWLARRIGLVNTMVFTHIPSSLFLASAVIAPSFPVAAVLFLLREGLVEMDVPTRQSYVMAVVRPEERVFASGVTHLVRMAAWAVAPSLAGLIMAGALPAAPFLIGAGMKIGYDFLLYTAFRKTKPPEES
jgi:MFS family permease